MKITFERRLSGTTDIIPWPRLFGLHSKRVSNKQRFCRQFQEHVRIPESLLELQKSYLIPRNLALTFPHGPMIWKVMQRNVWNDIVSWPTRRLNNATKYQLHALMTIGSKKRKWDLLENCQKFAGPCILPVLVDLNILWSVNKFARAISKWTRACDKRLARLISYIHHTCECKQYCDLGNTAKQCRLRLFQDSDFAGDLEDSKSTSGGLLCIFGSHTFVPTSLMCKKQT